MSATDKLLETIQGALKHERELGYEEGIKERVVEVVKLERKLEAWKPVVEAAVRMAEATDRHRVKGGIISEKNFVDYTCAADDIDQLVRKIPKEMRP